MRSFKSFICSPHPRSFLSSLVVVITVFFYSLLAPIDVATSDNRRTDKLFRHGFFFLRTHSHTLLFIIG